MWRKGVLFTVSSDSIGEEWSDKHAVLHDSILVCAWKKMTEESLLSRARPRDTFPATVTYSLKPEVVESLSLVEPLVSWADQHPELIAQVPI